MEDTSAPNPTIAVVATTTGGVETLALSESAPAEPGAGQVRVRVAGAAINPIDLSARAGRLADAGLLTQTTDIPLGWDVAGYVERAGPGVRRFRDGDPVIGLRDLLTAGGTHAETVILDETAVARAPRSVPLTVAAALPLIGLTADQSLARCGLRAGQSVLVTGAAGGVGRIVVQLAAARSLRVLALARPTDAEEMYRLGADHVLAVDGDITTAARALVPGGVDAVIDAAVIGVDAHGALRPGGTFVALVRPFAPPPLRGTEVTVHEVHADGARLAELAALVDAGELVLPAVTTVPLREAGRGHALAEEPGRRDRVVLVPDAPPKGGPGTSPDDGVTHLSLADLTWMEAGDGSSLAPLRVHGAGAGTAFLRFAPGARVGAHRHPAGEDLYVVRGTLRVGGRVLRAGDFLHTPTGGVHDATADEEAIILVSVPEPIEPIELVEAS